MSSPLLSTMTSRSPAPPLRTSSTLATAHGARHAVHAVPEIRAAAKCSDVCTSARREGTGRTLASQRTPAAADGLELQAEARWEQSMRLMQDDVTNTDSCQARHRLESAAAHKADESLLNHSRCRNVMVAFLAVVSQGGASCESPVGGGQRMHETTTAKR